MELSWKLLLFVLVAIFVTKLAIAADDEPTDDEWKEFKKKFNKTHSGSEDVKRRKNFANKHKLIKKHNAAADKGNQTFHMGHNQLSDMTDEEIIKQYTGFHGIPRNVTIPKSEQVIEDRQLPAWVDVRGHPCIAPVRDQKTCAACYAFAGTAALEWALCRARGNTFKALSEQHLIDCGGQNGCVSGRYEAAWDFAYYRPGQASRAVYPYTAVKGTCRNVAIVSSDRPNGWYYIPSEAAMASEIANFGVVTVGFHAVSSFFSYKTGVYSDATCDKTCKSANHAFTLVGYGTTSTGIPFWIMRNSWSTNWGELGYGRIIRGRNMCNILCWAARVY